MRLYDLIHFQISFKVALFPYIKIPTRYIFPATKIINIVVPKSNPMDRAICQAGTPKGILAIMATGEVNGMMDSQKPSGPSGLFIKEKLPYMPSIKGRIANKVNCCVSVSLSTAEPMAA